MRRRVLAVGIVVLLAMPLQSCATGKTWDWICYADKSGDYPPDPRLLFFAGLLIPAALAVTFAFDVVAFPFQIARGDWPYGDTPAGPYQAEAARRQERLNAGDGDPEKE